MTTTLITGANRGIGLALAKALAERGEHVLATCRTASDELAALNVDVVDGIDVTDEASLDRLANLGHLDVVILNAGVLAHESLDDLNLKTIRWQFEVNALAPLRATQALHGSLGAGSKIAIVTSRMGSIGDNTSGGYYGYRMSKAAVNMAAMSLARDLSGEGIAVRVIHPGLVATRMTRMAGITPQESAAGIIDRIDAMTVANTGEFWHANGERLPW